MGVVSRVEMTCGGGMGGSHWYVYGNFKEKPQIGQMAYLTDEISGEQITINPNYIVTIKAKQLVKVETDVTPHTNYSRTTCKKHIKIQYYWFDLMDSITAGSSYDSSAKEEIKNNFILAEDKITK
jgi:hypothetical protein